MVHIMIFLYWGLTPQQPFSWDFEGCTNYLVCLTCMSHKKVEQMLANLYSGLIVERSMTLSLSKGAYLSNFLQIE